MDGLTPDADALRARLGGPSPDAILAFVPPGEGAAAWVEAFARAWPDALRLGCEAVTQFAGAEVTGAGVLQAFWLERPSHRIEAELLRVGAGGIASDDVDRFGRALAAADAVFLIADGLRFPVQALLAALRGRRGEPLDGIAGGLASQREPIAGPGARVFLGDRIEDAACVALLFHGVGAEVEIVRGWDAASPLYPVTRARGNVLEEIAGEPAAEWYRRFLTVEGELAPLPETGLLFPLIVEGPRPERRGLYRSLRAFDEPAGAVTLWGDVQVGDEIRVGMGNGQSLVRTASSLPERPRAEAAVLYSCVGRQAVLGASEGEELKAIHEALGGPALAGFFTFGELGPSAGTGVAFYNQTAVLTLLREAP